MFRFHRREESIELKFMLRRTKTWPLLTLLGLVLVGLAAYFCRDSIYDLSDPVDHRPTYILVVLDDLDWDLVQQDWSNDTTTAPRFPVLQQLAKQGMVFSNFHATTPVCGPGRASILSGQFAHRHGARVNRPGHPTSHGFAGGFNEYGRNRDFSRHFQKGNYETCFVGKYVHDGFQPNRELGIGWPDLMPSGWSRFHAVMGANYNNFFVVDSATNQTRKVQDQYRIDYESAQVIAMLDGQKESRQAQLVCWFVLAPHDAEDLTPANPPRYAGEFLDETPPSFSRHPGSTGLKLPATLNALPSQLSQEQRAIIEEKWRERLRTIKAFDENLGRIRQYLSETDRLKNTVFVITSDHGYRLGDHGHMGKRLPYDRVTKVPLLISGKNIPAGRSDFLLGNIDLAPTLIDLALGPNSIPNSEFDGKSFAPLLSQPNIVPFQRHELLLECWEAENVWGTRVPGVWTILRGQNYSYTEWADGDREYYQLDSDPEQLDNRIDSLSSEQTATLKRRLAELRHSTERKPIITASTDSWTKLAAFPQNLSYTPLELSGYVDAELGVESVTLQVHDEVANQFWNGTEWQDSTASLSAELKNPDGLVSLWRFPLRISQPKLQNPTLPSEPIGSAPVERKISLVVSATNKSGVNENRTIEPPMTLRLSDPETWILPLGKPDPAATTFALSGFAHGPLPVRLVRITIQNKSDNTYWNGQAWVPDYVHMEAQVEPIATGGAKWDFTYRGELHDRLYFSARALDSEFHFDRTPAYFEYRLKEGVLNAVVNNAFQPDWVPQTLAAPNSDSGSN
ncbi:MAG: sulfatase-like hydrolase/transferase [Planctomycetaceae bacterium]|nr:sulfatase-like hydrolase/transferase [Planctomycetaceae bacterium]